MKKQYRTEAFAIIVTFIWGLIAHAYAFVNSNFSHDCLNAIMGGAIEENWKIALGRYFVPIYRSFFRGSITLPWLIGLLGIFWTALAVCLVIKMFDIEKKSFIVLVAGVMVTNITYISQIATYLYEFDFDAFALLMAVMAVYFWKNKNTFLGLLTGSIFVMLSIGIYQAYFSVALTLVICISVKELFDNSPVKGVLIKGIKGILMFLSGGILYFITGKIICYITQITPQARTDVFDFSGLGNPVRYYAILLIKTIIDVPNRILHAAYPAALITVVAIALVGILGILMIYTLIKMKFEPERIGLIVLLIAVLPLAMNSTHFLSRGTAHDLMIYAVWFFYITVLLYTHWFAEKEIAPQEWRKIPQVITCLLVFIVLWQNVIISNTAYLKKDLEAKSTLSTMTRVLTMIEAQEEYVYEETPVAFVGADNVYGIITEFDEIRNITGLFPNNAINSDTVTPRYNTYKAYFKCFLNYPINIVDEDIRVELKDSDTVKEMPAFPEKGCVKMIDDVLVVKMGEY